MPPYFAGQIRAALAIAREADAERASSRANASQLREELAARGFDCGASTTQIIPIMLGSNEWPCTSRRELQAPDLAASYSPADGSRRHGARPFFADQPDLAGRH